MPGAYFDWENNEFNGEEVLGSPQSGGDGMPAWIVPAAMAGYGAISNAMNSDKKNKATQADWLNQYILQLAQQANADPARAQEQYAKSLFWTQIMKNWTTQDRIGGPVYNTYGSADPGFKNIVETLSNPDTYRLTPTGPDGQLQFNPAPFQPVTDPHAYNDGGGYNPYDDRFMGSPTNPVLQYNPDAARADGGVFVNRPPDEDEEEIPQWEQ